MTARILMDATVYPPRGELQWIKRSVIVVADTTEEAKDAAWDWICDVEAQALSCVVTEIPTFRHHPPWDAMRRWDVHAEMLITERGM